VSEPRPPKTVEFYLRGLYFPFGRFITGIVCTVSTVLLFPVTVMIIALCVFSGEVSIAGIESTAARLAVAAAVGVLAWTVCFLAVLLAGTKVLLDKRGIRLTSAIENRLFVWNKVLAIKIDDCERGKCLEFQYTHKVGNEVTYSMRIPTEEKASEVSEFLLVRGDQDFSSSELILR
jgi:hypothetical protein